MPQQTIDGITWIYTTYSEGGTTYASIGVVVGARQQMKLG